MKAYGLKRQSKIESICLKVQYDLGCLYKKILYDQSFANELTKTECLYKKINFLFIPQILNHILPLLLVFYFNSMKGHQDFEKAKKKKNIKLERIWE